MYFAICSSALVNSTRARLWGSDRADGFLMSFLGPRGFVGLALAAFPALTLVFFAGRTTGSPAAFLFALNGSVAKAQIEAGLTAVHVTEIRTLGCAIVLLV